MNNLKQILRLARLHFLLFGFLLYLLGYLLSLLEGIEFDLVKFVFGYFVFGTAHLSVSFSNDYFDRESDRKSQKTPFSGGSKVLVNNPELESFAIGFAIFLLIISSVTNLFFIGTYNYDWWFFFFVLLGGLLGLFYSATPLKLSYRGLGELSTMLAVGFFMTGMGYLVASGEWGLLFLFLILPLSFYGLFFIITVELPDFESDIQAQKMNLVVKLGRKNGKIISLITTVMGTIYFALMLILEIVNNLIDWTPIVFFSILPLLASIVSLLSKTNNRRVLIRRVMFNMTSLVLFILLIDLSLLFQFIY